MHKDDLYAYWLTVEGTPEQQQSVYDLLNEKEIIGHYLEPGGLEERPYSSYQYPEKYGSGPEWNEEEMEEALHDITSKVPGVLLEIQGENTDDQSYGFIKRFHGDMFQERKLVVTQPSLIDGADIPFAQRHDRYGHAPEPIVSAMTLYEQMSDLLRAQPDAYYIARNLMYLTNNVEPNEEIPKEKLYKLAERLQNNAAIGFTQPFLYEERLDAVRVLLENGFRSEYDAMLGDLSPEKTLEFLLICSDDAFAYAVEETAASNQEKYAVEGYDDLGAAAFKKDRSAFESKSTAAAPNVFPRMTYVSVSDTATGWPAPNVPDCGSLQNYLRGYNVEFKHKETGEVEYGSAIYVANNVEDYYQGMLNAWGESGYAPFEVEISKGYEPTGRAVFRGYFTEEYDAAEHETFVKEANDQISKLLADNHYQLRPDADPHYYFIDNVLPMSLADRIDNAAKRAAAVAGKDPAKENTSEIEH